MLKNTKTFIAVLFLLSCAPKTFVPLPKPWEKPDYNKVVFGECNVDGCFLSHDAIEAMLKNQAQCESIRKGLVDLVKALQ